MAANVFPAINADLIITQYPYEETEEWLTATSTMEDGKSYAITQSPKLKRFTVNYPTIIQDELTILETFFNLMRGKLGEFEFTDDDGAVWHHVRFDDDEMSITYPEPAQISVTFHLVATPSKGVV